MNKKEYKEAFEAGRKYWSLIQTDEPLLYHPIDFEEWYKNKIKEKVNKIALESFTGGCSEIGTLNYIEARFEGYDLSWEELKEIVQSAYIEHKEKDIPTENNTNN